MSISDVMASTAIALTTLAMPKGMIYSNIFPESWSIYGTVATCSAQGFIFTTFTFLTFACDVILCIYYLCSIKFGMSDTVFSSRLEWVLYVLALLAILPITINNLLQGNYNPSTERAWCVEQPYPYDCEGDGCIRGEKISQGKPYYFFIVFCMIFITFLCLGLTVLHVYRKDRASIDAATRAQATTVTKNDDCELASNNSPESCSSGEVDEDQGNRTVSSNGEEANEDKSAVPVNQQMHGFKWTAVVKEAYPDAPSQLAANSVGFASNAASFNSGEEDESDEDDQGGTPERTYYSGIIIPSCTGEVKKDSPGINQKAQHYEDTKIIIKQASAYVSVYIIMGVLMLLVKLGLLINSVPFGVIHAIIRPSHGTLNMIIFLYQKYFILRKNHRLLTCCEVLGKIFRGESDENEIIVETMAPVIHDIAERRKGLYVIDEESNLDSIE